MLKFCLLTTIAISARLQASTPPVTSSSDDDAKPSITTTPYSPALSAAHAAALAKVRRLEDTILLAQAAAHEQINRQLYGIDRNVALIVHNQTVIMQALYELLICSKSARSDVRDNLQAQLRATRAHFDRPPERKSTGSISHTDAAGRR